MKFNDLFYFNRSDRTVIAVLLSLAILALAAIMLLSDGEEIGTAPATDSTVIARNDSNPDSPAPRYYDQGMPRAERFAFDPNTADSTALLRLGLQPWQVRSIYKYRAAGGIYRRKEDFARLYGLTQKQYRELEPYIRISSDYAPAADLFATRGNEYPTTDNRPPPSGNAATTASTRRYSPKLKANERIDLNESDTTALKRVPGIGSYFARQIVNYRTRLGGFYSVEQLREIENFPETAIPYFSPSDKTTKINVNKLSLNQLKRHPYINYYQARAIIDYRRLRGPLESLDQLKLLPEFTERDLKRLAHYVEY